MDKHELQKIQFQISYITNEINYDIQLMYQAGDIYTKNILLHHLWNNVSYLQYLNQFISYHIHLPAPQQPIPQQSTPSVPETTFTTEELAKFNGKNGNLAYIAVNGVVYDVTNNAAWAAATHFGLSAGNDLTQQFQSCHPNGQRILDQLPIVGRLVS